MILYLNLHLEHRPGYRFPHTTVNNSYAKMMYDLWPNHFGVVSFVALSGHIPSITHAQGSEDYSTRTDDSWQTAITSSVSHPTVYTLNFWYLYAKYVASSHNRTNCYVCTHMPIASSNPHIVPRPFLNIPES